MVPLRVGGGTRLKIFEAMAAGKAVVSTSVGAEGLDVHDGRLSQRDRAPVKRRVFDRRCTRQPVSPQSATRRFGGERLAGRKCGRAIAAAG